MTKEEAIKALKSNYPSSCYTMLREAVDMAIEALSQPPLPPDLDEAAEESMRRAYPGDAYYYIGRTGQRLFKKGFKAGAQWMAEQGETKEGLVLDTDFVDFEDNTFIDVCPNQETPAFNIKNGDKVIVQIRKK